MTGQMQSEHHAGQSQVIEKTSEASRTWQLEVISTINDVPAIEWDALAGKDYPFQQHAYLAALEASGAVSAGTGWHSAHLLVRDEQGRLLAGLLRYLKLHSRGEYVFDQQWAEALERAGGRYYPKQLTAIPFTPSAGPRLVMRAIHDSEDMSAMAGDMPTRREVLTWLWPKLMQGVAAPERVDGPPRRYEQSGFHLLFAQEDECDDWQAATTQLLRRPGMQYHWQSRGERDFSGWLEGLRSRRRKEIRRERRKVAEQGFSLLRLEGHQIGEEDLEAFYRCYCLTYLERGQRPYLSLDFFQRLKRQMPEALLLVQARDASQLPVAAALCLIGKDCLYGRWWGCEVEADCLHFEVCYYQGLEFCLERGLRRFDPGTQGEHKISRGFSAYDTWSLHWLAHPGLQEAVAESIEEEQRWMDRAREEVNGMLPYRQSSDQ